MEKTISEIIEESREKLLTGEVITTFTENEIWDY